MLLKVKYSLMDEATGDQPAGGGGVAPATPAVPAAPAPDTTASASPAAAPEPKAATPTFEKTGDAGLDFAIDFVSGLGITPTDPAYIAAEQGDFDLLRIKLATMGDKARGWEQVLAVAEKAHGNIAEAKAAEVATLVKTVHDAAGGEESWVELRDWAKANASPEEAKAINAMLNGSALQAKAAVGYLRSLFTASPDTSSAPAAAVPANTGGSQASTSNGPLSPSDYKAAIQELSRKLGPRIDDSPEYSALKLRRQAWRG